MANYELFFNNQKLEYEDGAGLNLTIKKIVDDMRNFAGSFGSFAANISNTLEIPNTQNNRRVLQQPHDPLARNFEIYNTLGELKILLNGSEVFSGQARVIAATLTKTATYAGTISLEVNPTATNLFTTLEQIDIKQLDMGAAGSTVADIRASHTAVTDTNNPIVWQPINYGGSPIPNNDTDLIFNMGDDPIGARPCIRLYPVIDAICRTAGYSLASNYIATECFRNKILPFTVGEDWERSDNWQNYRAHAEANNYSDVTGSRVFFSTEISDPENLIQASWFIAQVGGYYEFEIFVTGDVGSYDVVVEEWQGITFWGSTIIATANSGEVTKIPATDFYFNNYKAKLAVRFNSPSPTYTVSGFIKARLTKRAILTEPFKIASILPSVTAKDFLIALRQLFGWVIAVNETLKIIYIEPRFIRPLPQTFSPTTNDIDQAYYLVTAEPKKIKIDTENIVVQRDTVFGNKLLLALSENSENIGVKLYAESLQSNNFTDFSSQISDLFAVELGLSNTAQENTEQRNPLFAPITNYRVLLFNTSFSNKAQFPLICEDEKLLKPVGLFEQPTKPTFKGKLCILQYYGLLDFSTIPNYSYFVTEGYKLPLIQEFLIPSAFQVFPDDENYLSQLGGFQPYNVVFATLSYQAGSFGKVYGMFERYYSKFASLIYKATYINIDYLPSISDFISDQFRKPVKLEINGNIWVGWLIEIDNYSPIGSRFARATIILDHEVTDGDNSYTLKPNTDKPILLLSSFLQSAQDQP